MWDEPSVYRNKHPLKNIFVFMGLEIEHITHWAKKQHALGIQGYTPEIIDSII